MEPSSFIAFTVATLKEDQDGQRNGHASPVLQKTVPGRIFKEIIAVVFK